MIPLAILEVVHNAHEKSKCQDEKPKRTDVADGAEDELILKGRGEKQKGSQPAGPKTAREFPGDQENQQAYSRARHRGKKEIDRPADAKQFPDHGGQVNIQNPTTFPSLVQCSGSRCIQESVQFLSTYCRTTKIKEINDRPARLRQRGVVGAAPRHQRWQLQAVEPLAP